MPDNSSNDTMVQLLTPEGELAPAGPYATYLDALSDENFRTMYHDMAILRRFDAEATSLQRQGELGLWVPCVGQEAAHIGSGLASRPQDHVFPGYRDHGVCMERGIDLTQILAHVRGVDHAGWDPVAHNCHIYTLVVGGHLPHATGYAIGIRKDGACGTGDPARDEAVIVYFGEGATAEGDASESLVFASVNEAPIVFFCQNNHWAISEPNKREAHSPIYRRGEGFGVPGVLVDGNDVLATYAVTTAALDAARSGQGPQYIEASTYRMGAHTTSDDPTRYRDPAEYESWLQRDPLARMKAFLVKQQLVDDGFFAGIEAEGDALGERAREVCRSLRPAPFETYFDSVYATPNALVDEEKAWWMDYSASATNVETVA